MAVALLPVIGSAAGCGGGDGLPRQAVSGTVAFNGKPLKSGVITFVPGSPEISTQGGAPVADGRYEISKDVGLVPGKYKVSISSGEGSQEKKVDTVTDMPGMPPIPAKEAIPAEYGSGSKLEAEVKAGGANEFNFTIAAAPGK